MQINFSGNSPKWLAQGYGQEMNYLDASLRGVKFQKKTNSKSQKMRNTLQAAGN